jgi:hypothetical protein
VKRERKKRPGDGEIALPTEFHVESCMDCLHGDIADNEAEPACMYEYAREARVLREAAMLHKERLSLDELIEKISQRFLV